MNLIREYDDKRGSFMFLVQHSSAALHLPSRLIPKNHVPPVLPSELPFISPPPTTHSPRSNHDSRSSISERHADIISPVYEPSISDGVESDRQRQTVRGPQQPFVSPSYSASPVSPREHRPRYTPLPIPHSPPSISQRGQSPGGLLTMTTLSINHKPIILGPTPPLSISPRSGAFDPSHASRITRPLHAHTRSRCHREG